MSHQMKWNAVVVRRFVSTAIELFKRRLCQFISLLKKHHRFTLWIIVALWLLIKFLKGEFSFSEMMDNIVYNLLAGLLMPE